MSALSSLFAMEGLPLAPVAKVLGITSSAMLAGASVASTLWLVPVLGIAESNQEILSAQWRAAQQLDFYTAAPPGILAGLTWTWLALTSPRGTAIRWLYAIPAVLIPAAVPMSIIFQRRSNAPQNDEGKSAPGEPNLVAARSWRRHNNARAAVALVGTVCGAWAAFNEAFLSGIQIGTSALIGELIRQQAINAAR